MNRRHDDSAGIAGVSLLAAAAMVILALIVSGAQHLLLVYGPVLREILLTTNPWVLFGLACIWAALGLFATCAMSAIERGPRLRP